MVRGTSRRVIVVDSPDTELFEQAIFIVRADAATRSGVTAQKLVDASALTESSPARLACAVVQHRRGLHRAHLAHQRADLTAALVFSSRGMAAETAVPRFFCQVAQFSIYKR